MVFSLSTLKEFFNSYQQNNPLTIAIDNDGYIKLIPFIDVLKQKLSYISIVHYVRQISDNGEFEINLSDVQIERIFLLISNDIHTNNVKIVKNIHTKIAEVVLGTFKQ